MSEPISPGIYVEEVGQGATPIEGVATAIAAFIGPTGHGPTSPVQVGSVSEYRQVFGGAFADPGHMLPAVVGFFENGGRHAVVLRVTRPASGPLTAADYDPALAALADDALGHVALVYAPNAQATPGLVPRLIAHCERSRYRFLVLDAPADTTRPVAPADTRNAALYHPWIQVADPDTGSRHLVPPGGHVLGVYARTDAERGVFKAPAGATVRGAVGLARTVTRALQDAFSAAGVNLIRTVTGRGIQVWGARTLSSDPEWKSISVRRLFLYLERSIDLGTRWVVFEPNDERLWTRVRDTVTPFMRAQWRAGALMGTTENEAFFVRCDRTTMTQADIDNGRLVCLIGIAPIRPAEFVIFRIGQWTADRPE